MFSNNGKSSLDLRTKALEIAKKLQALKAPSSEASIASSEPPKMPLANPERKAFSENLTRFANKTSYLSPAQNSGEQTSEWNKSVKKTSTKSPPKSCESKGPVPNPSELRIFVKNLNKTTTEAKLKAYFGRWGVVSDVCIRKPEKSFHDNPNMAFITFASYFNESPTNVPIHVIDGKSVPVHLIGTMPNARFPVVGKSNSIMVTGAIHRSSEFDLRETFGKFGIIRKVTRKRDPDNPAQFLRYAFIVYSNEKSVDDLIQNGKSLKVSGQVVDVRRVKNQY